MINTHANVHMLSFSAALEQLQDHLQNPAHLVEMKFLLLEQKFLELLARRDRIGALRVLQAEMTPLRHNRARTHELSSYLMLSRREDIARVTRTREEATTVVGASPPQALSRVDLMDRLQTFLPASIMLPPRR